MRGGYPASCIPHPASHVPHRTAFTLVEVLIALAILALLAYTTASSLSTALRAGSSAELLREGVKISDELQTEILLIGAPSNTLARYASTWTFNVAGAASGPATNRILWNVWEIVSRERPSIQQRIALEQSK